MASLPPGADLSKIPLSPNPTVPSNFVDPPSLAPIIVGLSTTLIIISLVFITARLYSNLHSVRKLGWDDCFSALGLIFTFAYNGLLISMDRTARRGWNVPLSYFDASYIKSAYAIDMVYNPGIFFAKAAILTLYMRIFATKMGMRILIYSALVVLFLVYFAMIPVATVYCTPRTGEGWNLLLLEKCHTTATTAVVQGVFGLVSDVYIFMLPLPVIYNLHLPFRRKLALSLVFMAGIFAIVASALGLYFRVLEFRSKDPTWNGASTEICVIVENYITIIVGCTPAVAAFWRNHVISTAFFQSIQSLLSSIRAPSSSDKGTTKVKVHAGSKVYDLAHPQPKNYIELSVGSESVPRQMGAYITDEDAGKGSQVILSTISR